MGQQQSNSVNRFIRYEPQTPEAVISRFSCEAKQNHRWKY